MSKKMFTGSVVMLVVVIMCMVTAVSLARAASSSDRADMAAQIDQIATNQGTILAELAEIKEQLRIVTIRVTQAQ